MPQGNKGKTLRLTMAQLNPTVGDIDGNADKMLDTMEKIDPDVDLVVFPELFLSGYPPEDLVLNKAFKEKLREKIFDLKDISKKYSPAMLFGTPWREAEKMYNAAALIHRGELVGVTYKFDLPNYAEFDEKRTFTAGSLPKPIEWCGYKLGVIICEDMWNFQPAEHLKENGAENLIVLNASPYGDVKGMMRHALAKKRVKETGLPLHYLNMVGGQDELVFDGSSFVMDKNTEVLHRMKSFEEDVFDEGKDTKIKPEYPYVDYDHEETYKALKLGLKDYVNKNGFPGVLLGLSGGIDSALSATIAVDALGAQNVHCVMMPSAFTSQDSLDDAEQLTKNLDCKYEVIPIKDAMKEFENTIPNLQGLAHENTQSRIRGTILMALSNMNGKMVLACGNKSEMAVGYATLYGDMCGGFSVLKDVYKTRVYALAEWRNKQSPVIPERIITKAPTAELRDGQTDQDSLPPYEQLDDILNYLIEYDESIVTICERGHDRATVIRIWKMLDRAEYKRYQSSPGVKITSRAFGRDRRYPMTNIFTNKIQVSSPRRSEGTHQLRGSSEDDQ